ncbi:MAG: hypothetical protein KAS71_07560 [Bacteroidales bacterium]|nr:hypothetical protein [Bacteroidales bacterium]
MVFILLSILSATSIFFVFRYISKLKIPSLPVIVINYSIASTIGFLVGGEKLAFNKFYNSDWFLLAFIIGILFILLFFLLGKSTQASGMSITTVASKMSVVIPISFSLLKDPSDQPGLLKFAGILIALVAVYLTIYQRDSLQTKRAKIGYPILLFIGMGFVDSLVKYSQYKYVNNEESGYFSAMLFLISFLTGLVILIFRKNEWTGLKDARVIVLGIVLGIVNFGSIYFLIRALNFKNVNGIGIDSSIVFGINNSTIVLLSVLAGMLIFREKLSGINKIGISLSILAIIIFSIA